MAWVDAALARLDEADKRAVLDRRLVPGTPLPPWLPWALGGFGGAVAGLGFFAHYAALRRVVRERTGELRTTVAELARANAELDGRAHVDAATGIANRHRFRGAAAGEIERATRYGRPLALVLVDVDGLKAINDRLGHLAGDRAVARIARILANGVREIDLVAPWGGDEFAVLLSETGAGEAQHTAERLKPAVADATIDVAGATVPLAISVGAAPYPSGDAQLDAWLAAAGHALYAGKGRAGVQSERA